MRECTHLPCPWPHRCRRQQPHFVPSSTPFLARSGLEALATVRVEEDTGAVPRSDTGSVAFGRNGLSSSNGRLVRSRPFAHSDRFPGHKGAGKAGCPLAPAIVRTRCTRVTARCAGTPGLPCTMVLRFIARSPWRRIPLASIADELTIPVTRLGPANLRQFDT